MPLPGEEPTTFFLRRTEIVDQIGLRLLVLLSKRPLRGSPDIQSFN
jgi:hypothetical protein